MRPTRPLAAVVPEEGQTLDLAELKAFLGERLARWQLPERWAVIDEVPRTSVGKFDKKVLRANATPIKEKEGVKQEARK